jgi:geranylgeranyl diphosphate synthase type II
MTSQDSRSTLDAYLSTWAERVHTRLGELVPGGDLRVQEAMRYSVLAGGKRLRPVLAIAAHEAAGGKAEEVLDPACALELIHTYSLIHDDLPAMDDADLRRGKPTSHKVFGEAIAILAGDALLPQAFEIIAATVDRFPAERVVRVIAELAGAVGDHGMVAGQDLDLDAEHKRVDRQQLERIHRLKTGALLEASLRLGAILGGAGEEQLTRLTRYGSAIGLAFQVVDDLLDVRSDAATLGKNPGDQEREKSTYPALLGVDASEELARELAAKARIEVADMGSIGTVLAALADFVVTRRS